MDRRFNSGRKLKKKARKKAKRKNECRKFDICPIVERFMARKEQIEEACGQTVKACSDNVYFYDPEFLLDESMSSYCSKLRKMRERFKDLRITWEAPVFGPSGYASAARGYIIGLADLGVRVNVQPIWGDCDITCEDED